MPDWLSQLLISMGLLALCWSFLRAPHPAWRRIGLWMLVISLGLLIWLWTGSWAMGLLGWVIWFAVPILQAVVASRRMRFSLNRRLEEGFLSPEHFPDLSSLTRDLRDQGFESFEDFWLKPSPQEQAYRIGRHESEPVIVALAHIIQGPVQLRYLMFITPDKEGNHWVTWDYPLAYGFKLPPAFKVYRYVDGESVGELMDQHRAFMEINEVQSPALPENADAIRETMEKIFSGTMAYNLKVGLLEQSDSGDEVRYSWRGSLYLAGQVFRDVISA